MPLYFKNIPSKTQVIRTVAEEVIPLEEKPVEKKKNNSRKKASDMNTNNEQMVNEAEAITNEMSNVKLVKKERGLIERTESSKIILTEDNRQVLND